MFLRQEIKFNLYSCHIRKNDMLWLSLDTVAVINSICEHPVSFPRFHSVNGRALCNPEHIHDQHESWYLAKMPSVMTFWKGSVKFRSNIFWFSPCLTFFSVLKCFLGRANFPGTNAPFMFLPTSSFPWALSLTSSAWKCLGIAASFPSKWYL